MQRDYQIRQYLYNNNLHKYLDDNNSIVLDEWQMGDSRIDIGVVNGIITGYELKSKKDTLTRLPKQINDYLNVCDELTLVVDDSHLEKIVYEVPQCIGIIVVKQDRLVNFRKATLNKKTINSQIAMLLWRDEMIDLISKKLERGFKNKTRAQLAILMTEIFKQETANIVREQIKKRYQQGWRKSENNINISYFMK